MISPFGYIVDENREISPFGEIDFEKDIAEFESRCDEISSMMREIIRSENPRSVNSNAFMSLEYAVCLPILGGEIREDGTRVKSLSFSRRTLLTAIKRGQLKAVFRKNAFLTTENNINEWLEWQENKQEQGFGSNQSGTTKADQLLKGHGTSATQRSTENPLKSARESALERLTRSREERLRSQNI